jgi:hypothetical protein
MLVARYGQKRHFDLNLMLLPSRQIPLAETVLNAQWLAWLAQADEEDLIRSLIVMPPFRLPSTSSRNFLAYMCYAPAVNASFLRRYITLWQHEAPGIFDCLAVLVCRYHRYTPRPAREALADLIYADPVSFISTGAPARLCFAFAAAHRWISGAVPDLYEPVLADGTSEYAACALLLHDLPLDVVATVASSLCRGTFLDTPAKSCCRLRLALHSSTYIPALLGHPYMSREALNLTAPAIASRPHLTSMPHVRLQLLQEFVDSASWPAVLGVWLDNESSDLLGDLLAIALSHSGPNAGSRSGWEPQPALVAAFMDAASVALLEAIPGDLFIDMLISPSSLLRHAAISARSRLHSSSSAVLRPWVPPLASLDLLDV